MIEKLLNSYWKSFRNFLQESITMKLRVTILFVYFIFFVNHSQIIIEDTEEKNFTFLKAVSVWNIDELQNVYLIQGSTLIKCDSSGKQLFSQSIKSIGNVAQIEPINALKIAVFSEEQQSICLFDNTLTLNSECNYLDKYGIRNAKLITRSNRSNLFWIYDQFNSTLLLIDIISNKTIQKVDNIKGLILKDEDEEENEVEKIQEFNNHLYLIDSKETIYEFDQLMTLNREFIKHSKKIAFWDNQLIEMEENKTWITSLINKEIKNYTSTNRNPKDIKIKGKFLYMNIENKILRFVLKSL
jgi:hypothetical protein